MWTSGDRGWRFSIILCILTFILYFIGFTFIGPSDCTGQTASRIICNIKLKTLYTFYPVTYLVEEQQAYIRDPITVKTDFEEGFAGFFLIFGGLLMLSFLILLSSIYCIYIIATFLRQKTSAHISLPKHKSAIIAKYIAELVLAFMVAAFVSIVGLILFNLVDGLKLYMLPAKFSWVLVIIGGAVWGLPVSIFLLFLKFLYKNSSSG